MKGAVLVIAVLAAVASFASVGRTAPAATGSAATVSTASSSLGRILVDGQRRALYLFEKDKRGRSACSGTCSVYWPPLLTHSRPTARGGVNQSLFGVTRRSDGRSQVTYAGHPLYHFVQDTLPGQIDGQDSEAFGAGWYVVSPAGKKIEKDDG